jgi:hypothetical protein
MEHLSLLNSNLDQLSTQVLSDIEMVIQIAPQAFTGSFQISCDRVAKWRQLH